MCTVYPESRASMHSQITVGQFLINTPGNCVLGKSDQITNPIIVNVNPVLYYSIHVCEYINCKCRKTRNLQLPYGTDTFTLA